MSLDSNQQPTRRRSEEDLWPTWMWIAVPVLVVVVVGGLWWAIFYPSETASPAPTPSPTMDALTQPTESPAVDETVALEEATPTRDILSPPEAETPTPETAATPTEEEEEPAEEEGLSVGTEATVSGTGAMGLNIRSDAGTSHRLLRTIPDGSTVELIGGPKEANGYTWWEVRDDAGQTGWVIDPYLSPK